VILLEYPDTKFIKMYHKIGGTPRIVKSRDFILSLLISIIFVIIVANCHKEVIVITTLCPIFIVLSATMIAIAIAGLAIIASLSDPDFIKILMKIDIFDNVLFFFRFSTFISGLSIISNIFTYISILFCVCNLVLIISLLFSMFLVLYSLFSVLSLVGTTMRYGLYRGAFIAKEVDEAKKI